MRSDGNEILLAGRFQIVLAAMGALLGMDFVIDELGVRGRFGPKKAAMLAVFLRKPPPKPFERADVAWVRSVTPWSVAGMGKGGRNSSRTIRPVASRFERDRVTHPLADVFTMFHGK